VNDFPFFRSCDSEASFSTAKDSWLREASKKRRAKKIFMVDEFWGQEN